MFIPTHTGVLCYCNGTVSLRYRVPLRATAQRYITKMGSQFRKTDGSLVRSRTLRNDGHSLDLSTICEVKR